MNRSRRARLLALALAGLLLAPVPAATSNGAPTLPRAGPSVLFVLIDTLRADHLSAYGYERPTSPVLDEIAARGVRFAQVRSQASWTKPSMASLWTGVYPVGTGVLRFSHGLPERAVMPAEILSEAGYRTAGLWRNGWVAENFGFGQGFDVYVRPPRGRAAERRFGGTAPPTDLDLTDSAREFLRTFRDRPFLLYVHYMDVHQYLYDEGSALFGTGYADAYDNAIRWVDTNVGLLIDELAKLELLDRTLVVIAADHGEEFADHGSEGHGRTLYHEVTHVPLLMMQQGVLPAGRVVEQRVQNVDIWPTILALLGQDGLPDAHGRSRVPLIVGDGAPGAGEATFSHLERGWGRARPEPRPLVSVTQGGQRLIRPVVPPGRDQLFDLASDPDELRNLAAEQPEAAAELAARIDAYLTLPAPWEEAAEVELDAMRIEQLRALGYIGIGAGREADADPGKPAGAER